MRYWRLCKYAWVVRLKDKKGISITNVFQEILDKFEPKANMPGCKPNKIWLDEGG